MMQLNSIRDPDYTLYAGFRVENIKTSPTPPFDNLAISFLNELSDKLMADREARRYPDIISFAFWCRRASLSQKKKQLKLEPYTIGRGLAFHVTPSNIPVNFAFSFAFGLLSGNSNLVRVPRISHKQTQIILGYLNSLFETTRYENLKNRNSFIYYDRNEKINCTFSSQSDCRLIWGGDQTVHYFKSLPTHARNVDLCFADRYSITILGARDIILLSDTELRQFCNNFYNDNLQFHQFACSSSHLVNWQGCDNDIAIAREKFWLELNLITDARGEMSATDYIDRFAKVGNLAFRQGDFTMSSNIGDAIYRSDLEHHTTDYENYRIGYGSFSEIKNISYKALSEKITSRYQTITYFGIDPSELARNLISAGVKGVDRVVPVGSALSLDLVWDGYDIIRTLTRIIEVK